MLICSSAFVHYLRTLIHHLSKMNLTMLHIDILYDHINTCSRQVTMMDELDTDHCPVMTIEAAITTATSCNNWPNKYQTNDLSRSAPARPLLAYLFIYLSCHNSIGYRRCHFCSSISVMHSLSSF